MKWFQTGLSVLQKYDWWLILAAMLLTVFGLSSIYGVDRSRGAILTLLPTQILALIIGTTLLFVAGSFHISFYQSKAKFIYIVSLALLIAVLFFGLNIKGTRGWFRFGGVSFQPVEFAKVALVLFMGLFINHQSRRFDRLRFIIGSGLIVLLPIVIIMAQPDLGSALVFAAVWFGLLLLCGVKKRYIGALIVIGIIVATLGWVFFFKDYQKERIKTFLDPGRDRLNRGYNVTQSIIAIGSGQWLGRGLGRGSQSQLHFLPEVQTDFIFSVIAEELGLLGVFLILVLYILLLWRLIIIAKHADNDFGAYTVLGIFLLFFVHIFLNIGAATGVMPLTGITLPFLSYGGSSLVINFLLIGVAESVARSARPKTSLELLET